MLETSMWIDLLEKRTEQQRDQVCFTFLVDDAKELCRLTYLELRAQARSIAASLQELTEPGDRVVLMFPPGLKFISAFFGCVYAGVIAVPAPLRAHGTSRIDGIITNADPRLVMVPAGERERRAAIAPLTSERQAWVTFEELLGGNARDWKQPCIVPSTTLMLQYTSGSTSHPKGVMISHENLVHNSEIIKTAFRLNQESVSVSWLPGYHDMGLIDGILQPIHTGFHAYLMAPMTFLQRPVSWLSAISRVRATHSGGPDFSYALCARKISLEEQAELDLQCWTSAYNGAEPVRSATLRRFAEKFRNNGFEPRFFYPCYGLAEATLMVTGGDVDQPPSEFSGSPCSSMESGSAPLRVESSASRIGCGWPWLDTKVAIVDLGTLSECQPGAVGEIWVKGKGVAQGYWRNPEATNAVFRAKLDTDEGPYLRTGDLGAVHDSQLYVYGRLKDLLILRGANYLPEEIEATVEECHPLIGRGRAAAFTVEIDGMSELVIAIEMERRRYPLEILQELIASVRQAVVKHHDVAVHSVSVLKAGRLRRTSSGKIARHACQRGFIECSVPELVRSCLSVADNSENYLQLSRLDLIAMSREHRFAALSEHVRMKLSRLLDMPPESIDMRQPLVSMGLDSLCAIEFAHALAQAFGVVVQAPVLLGDMNGEGVVSCLVIELEVGQEWAERQLAETPQIPLSEAQKALWFLHQLEPTAYTLAFAARLTGSLDIDTLGRSYQWLVERHFSLRSTIVRKGSELIQRVLPSSSAGLIREVVIGEWSETDLRHELARSAREPFDLEGGPLIRACLYRIPDGDILLLTAHHAITDGWSFSVMLRDWEVAYHAMLTGCTPNLPVPAQPVQHVRWQQEFLASPQATEQLAYWRQQLQGADLSLELFANRLVRTSGDVRHNINPDAIDAEVVCRLRDLAKTRNATFYTVLLASFQLLLHRYTGRDDIVVRSTVDGRHRPEFADVVGYLVNQLLMRTNCAGNPTFFELLDRTRDTVMGALAHQDYPFPLLINELNSQRDGTGQTLARVAFVMQRLRGKPAITGLVFGHGGDSVTWKGGLTLEAYPLPSQAMLLDLTLTIVDAGDKCDVRWEFDPNRFDPADIARLDGHWRTLLRAIANRPGCRIGELQLLSETEKHRQAITWNDTVQPYPRDLCLHELIEEQVMHTPDHIAVQCNGQMLTYRELDRKSDQLAANLGAQGGGLRKLIVCCLMPNLDLLVGLLAVLKLGAAYVPIDPSLPKRRIAWSINDANAAVVLTNKELQGTFDTGGRPLVVVEECRQAITSPEVGINFRQARLRVGPEDLAYVIYTSGSTGMPKGVMVPHRAVVNYLTWCANFYQMTAGDGSPVTLPIGFDASITTLFGPLLTGSTVTLLPDITDLAAIADVLRGPRKFSAIKITPAHLGVLSRFLLGQPRISTHRIVVGGEALTTAAVEPWLKYDPRPRIINEYGPTEATVGCCVHEVGEEEVKRGVIPIGRPIANTQIYILDQYCDIVPVGVTGELYVGGDGLASGYLNRPELTCERFIPDPLDVRPGHRLYKTGDLARYQADGTIEYVGRTDNQVKLRGFRIEPAEIETALRQCPPIESAVVAVKEIHGERKLVAYVRLNKDQTLNVRGIETFLAGQLPAYMIPWAFVPIKEFPLTPHGKIDRERLPLPQVRALGDGPRSVTTLEQVIVDVWKRILRLDQVELDDNFFDLGGDSLRASEVQHTLEKELGRRISLRVVLQFGTIRALAKHLSGFVPEPTDAATFGRSVRLRLAAQRGLAARVRRSADESGGME